jgi:ERF superfamily
LETAIDKDAGVVNLTTMLAHALRRVNCLGLAGCAQDCQSPRMGSALTYARRYALFTLVGIAGEDDL